MNFRNVRNVNMAPIFSVENLWVSYCIMYKDPLNVAKILAKTNHVSI